MVAIDTTQSTSYITQLPVPMDDDFTSCSLAEILHVSLPAIVLNAAPTATSMAQTALLGHYASTQALAAYSAVSISAGTLLSVFNFLADGVAAKVGLSVGQRDWHAMTARVRLALAWYARNTYCTFSIHTFPKRARHRPHLLCPAPRL